MKLTFKTLQQSTFKVEIEPDKTVKELKDKIEKDQGKNYPSAFQKLIYAGKILSDENKISEYEIDEKKFLVLMMTRPPPAPKPQQAVEKQSTSKKEELTKAKISEDTKPAQQTSSTTTSSSSSTTTSVSATSTTTPATTTPSTTSTTQNIPDARPPGRTLGAVNPSLLSMHDPHMERLASLVSQPQFRQLQDLIQQSPHLLSSTIEALASSDPELYNLISDNPDVFVSALNHPPLSGSRTQSSRSSTTGGGRDLPRPPGAQQQAPVPASGGNAGGRQQPVVDQMLVDVSEHDKEAIERLKELGFSEYLAVQAYMACDKDEQLAADLLFQMDQ